MKEFLFFFENLTSLWLQSNSVLKISLSRINLRPFHEFLIFSRYYYYFFLLLTFYSFVVDILISCFCVFQLDNEDSDEEFEDDEYGIGLPM